MEDGNPPDWSNTPPQPPTNPCPTEYAVFLLKKTNRPTKKKANHLPSHPMPPCLSGTKQSNGLLPQFGRNLPAQCLDPLDQHLPLLQHFAHVVDR